LDFFQPAPWHFFYRFVMVVRKNVLKYYYHRIGCR
jgi:hypothetical protein